MTTIAVSETEIAWDSQLTNGNVRHQALTEKVSVIGKTIYGCAGDAGACQHAPEWHAKGARVRSAPKGEWTMLVVTRRGLRVYDENNLGGVKLAFPFAIGSGEDFALTAMRTGKTAAEAVQIACDMDIFSGGPVKFLKFATVWQGEKKCSPKKKSTPRSRARSSSTSSRARSSRSKT